MNDGIKYYIVDASQSTGFREVTEVEFEEWRRHNIEVVLYYEQIIHNEITIDDVPETHKTDVELKLAPTTEEKAQAYDILIGNEVIK